MWELKRSSETLAGFYQERKNTEKEKERN